MSKKRESKKQPFIEKAEIRPYDSTCPQCKGTREVQAPTHPGFEGKPTFAMPCLNCR